MAVPTVCMFVGASVAATGFVLLFGCMWFVLLHKDESGFEIGWVGLYGMLTLVITALFIGL